MSDGSLRFVSGLQAHHRLLPPNQSGAIYICTMLVYPLVLMHSRTHTVRTCMYVCTYVRYHQRQLRMSRSNLCDPGGLT
ncbi:hypothetical protein F4815DRAFT_453010 [Daldinia loculata]|nr:hypothetical protein F4815DRAFT_453010 [Daldinia loculata]